MVVVLIVKYSIQENLNSKKKKNFSIEIKIKFNELQNDMNLYHQLDEDILLE
jgi:hypothetical protein